jgi:hypothetical protein
MRNKVLFGVALVVSAGLSVLAAAGKPGSDPGVISIINTYDSGIAPSLQIQDDGLGRYTNSATQASLITNGDWRLDALYLKGATRKISFIFNQPIPGTGPGGGAPVAPPSGQYTANFGVNCSNFGSSFARVLPGQTTPCPMDARFQYGGNDYVLHMAPRSVNFPESDGVNVTCIFPTSGTSPCSQWRIQPGVAYTYTDLDGTVKQGLRSVANLSIETTVRNQVSYVKQGDFYFSFSILVTNP